MENRRTRSTPIRLTSKAQHVVRLNNLLLNKSAGFTFRINTEQLFRFRMLPGDMDMQSVCPISLTLAVGNTTGALWLTEWPLEKNIQRFVPNIILGELPENLAISVIESALEPLLQQAERGLDLKLSVQSMSAAPSSPMYSMPLGFEIQEFNPESNEVYYSGKGLLLLDSQLYPHLQERLSYWPSDTNEDWEEHYTSAWIEISNTTLSMKEINQLQTSDLILLENTRFQDEGEIRLRLDSGYYCEAKFESLAKSSLAINSEWIPMSENESKQNVEHISQLPVKLSFDLGEKELTFNEVRQLRPGYILELGKSLPEIVQIRSQHRLIGTGELVEINGRVGVRILDLFNKKAKRS